MNLFDPSVRERIKQRVRNLQPDSQRQWGRMDTAKMVCHISDQLRAGLGDIPTKLIKSPMAYPPVKQLVVYVLPWPKGKVKAPSEAFTTAPAGWDHDKGKLIELIDRFAARGPGGAWPIHPLFGRMSGRMWGALSGKHLDHHLRQFGM